MFRSLRAAQRLLACIRIARLPIQAELVRRPELAHLPVVIAAPAHARPVIINCSAAAEARGLYPGMPLREVLPTCRDAVVLPPDLAHYAAVHEAFLDALEEIAPAVEEAEMGCAYADLTGMQLLYPRPAVLLHTLADAAPRGFAPHVGAGPNKFVAGVAARVADEGSPVLISADAAVNFLAPHTVRYLPVSDEMQRRLALFGLTTLGQVARLGAAAMQAQFGREGGQAWELARGVDRTPFVPRRPFRPISASLVLPAPVTHWEAFWVSLRQLLAQVWRREERARRTVRQLQLQARIEGEQTWERTITLPEPIGDLERLSAILRRRLEGSALPGAIEALTLKLTVLGGPYAGQGALFTGGSERWQRIGAAAARLRIRYGTAVLHRIVEVEPWSRIPERRYALISFEP